MALRALIVVLLLAPALAGCATPPQMPEFLGFGWLYPSTAPTAPPPGLVDPSLGLPEMVPPGGMPPGAPPLAAAGPPPSTLFVPVADGNVVWENLVNSVDTYFDIAREERVRLVGDVVTEGRLTTMPEVGSTLLEPWRGDSVGGYERLESTLQSIRRQAIVRVSPGQGGWLVDVAVYKELEDVPQPQFATASAAAFRSENTIIRYVEPVALEPRTAGWIPLGRDPPLEQRILRDLERKLGMTATKRIRGGAR